MPISEHDYYEARLRQEQECAARASCPEASAAHRNLADLYQRRLNSLQGELAPMPLRAFARRN